MKRVATGHELAAWNANEAHLEEFHRLRPKLQRFVDEKIGDADDVGKSVCAFLEAYLRVFDPDRLQFGKFLGDYAASDAPAMTAKRLKSFDQLKAWCAPFRHSHGNTGIPPSRNPDEVTNYVRQALDWVDPNTDWSN